MKLQLSIRLISIIGIFFLTLSMPPGNANINEVYGLDPGSSIDVIDLGIESVIDLESSSSFEFTREFSIGQKQEVYLLHIDVQASENTVDEVTISAEINSMVTIAYFEDSSSNYSSSHSFYGGTRLSFRIDPATTIYVLSNTLNLTIDVVSSSYFGELGTFEVKSATFESLTTPIIDTDSANTPVPMEISNGSWYIAPLSTINKRTFVSKLFCEIPEDIYLRLDVDITPSDYPLSSLDFKVSNGSTTFNGELSEISSMRGTIYAHLTKGDSLVLEFTFRATSDLADSVIELEVKAKASYVEVPPDNGPSGPDGKNEEIKFNFMNMTLADLELLRFSMMFIPLYFYYNRSKNRNKSYKSDIIKKGDTIGINEE
jgi:hypothetical protein